MDAFNCLFFTRSTNSSVNYLTIRFIVNILKPPLSLGLDTFLNSFTRDVHAYGRIFTLVCTHHSMHLHTYPIILHERSKDCIYQQHVYHILHTYVCLYLLACRILNGFFRTVIILLGSLSSYISSEVM